MHTCTHTDTPYGLDHKLESIADHCNVVLYGFKSVYALLGVEIETRTLEFMQKLEVYVSIGRSVGLEWYHDRVQTKCTKNNKLKI